MSTIDNGRYHARYSGAFGSGEAQFILKDGQVFGSDVGGGQYFGKCAPVPGTDKVEFLLNLKLLVPNFLVFEGKARAAGEEVNIKIALSPNDLGKPVTVNLSGYSLTFVLTKIGALPMAA